MMKSLSEKYALFLTFVFIGVVCFFNLDYLSIRAYDEGRNAVNAFEMYLNPKSFFYTTFEKNIDSWNTKPPMLIWLQVLFMKIIGPGEWAIRLPSAVSGIGIAFLLYTFIKRISAPIWVTIFSLILLFSNWLFTGIHVLRTGDYDALFTFFTLGFVFYFFNYTHSKNQKELITSCTFLTFGILTKGIAAFFFLPGIFMYLLLFGEIKKILLNLLFWKAVLIPVFFGLGYYLIRELVTPGYLELVWLNEIAGRYTQVENYGNVNSYSYYFTQIKSCFGLKTLMLVFMALPLSYYLKKYYSITSYLSLLTITFLLILSFSKTKLFWYLAPIISLISFLAGIGLVLLFEWLTLFSRIRRFDFVFYLCTITFWVEGSVRRTISDRLSPIDTNMQQFSLSYKFRYFLDKGQTLPVNFAYVDFDHYKPHYLFYSYLSKANYKFENFNYFKLNKFGKIATDIIPIKNYIERNFPLIEKKQFKDLSYYSLGDFSEKNDKRLISFEEILKKRITNNDIDIIKNPNDPTNFMVIKKFDAKLSTLNLYFRRTNSDGTFDYDVIEISNNWDYLNINGYSIKFVLIRDIATHLEYKAFDSRGKEVWTKNRIF